MITKKKEQPLAVAESTESWARCVRELMQRHDVSSRKFGRVVGEILGMEYMAGYRRAWGKHPWRLDEIEKIASHFGETAAQVLEPLLAQPAEPAVLMVGNLKVKCTAVLGKQLVPPFTDRLVAIGGLDTWLILPGTDIALPAREVRKIVFSSSTPVCEPTST
ncbi:helix-turn-helix domain-containing protein [Azohydromonas australica]|uniref:helix-turn-helix domain-containing protein n=1 Tax=Azohydromonas australica TaxID=364039 RepID=UPI00146ADF65|nr:helix-turn-helix domain-containing protein [Azohydromonas australica]